MIALASMRLNLFNPLSSTSTACPSDLSACIYKKYIPTYVCIYTCVYVCIMYTYMYVCVCVYVFTQAFLIQVKFYEVICIINFKNTLFKGFTRGGPWVPSLVKQNLNRTQKYKVIALKTKKTFLRTLQGGTLGRPSLTKQNFSRTQIYEVFTA